MAGVRLVLVDAVAVNGGGGGGGFDCACAELEGMFDGRPVVLMESAGCCCCEVDG